MTAQDQYQCTLTYWHIRVMHGSLQGKIFHYRSPSDFSLEQAVTAWFDCFREENEEVETSLYGTVFEEGASEGVPVGIHAEKIVKYICRRES